MIHFWKLEFNRYMMVCSLFKKYMYGMRVQRMLEMSRCLYTGRNFKQNIGGKSIEINDLLYHFDLPISRFDANLSFG